MPYFSPSFFFFFFFFDFGPIFLGGKSGGVGREVAFIDDYKEKPRINKPCSYQ
jgi:hypothetical protein